MELQLGLSLPTANNNNNGEVIVQSWLPLPLPAGNNGGNGTECFDASAGKRRRFVDDDLKTLPLLQWAGGCGDENDDNCSSVVLNKIETEEEEEGEEDGDGDGIVGWPPINFRRKKKLRNQREHQNVMVTNRCSSSSAGFSSMYVKVTMDGVGIGRKVDLALHDSFPSLRRQLFAMFGLPEENRWDGGAGAGEYQLTYQDTEGDWLLADDISWRSFIGSVQRLRLMRSSSSGSS